MNHENLEKYADECLTTGLANIWRALAIYRNTENIRRIALCRRVLGNLAGKDKLNEYEDNLTLQASEEIRKYDIAYADDRKNLLTSLVHIFEQVKKKK